ncbi:MAG TPA: hypothetical protein VFE56_09825, partial [Candidatus Binataceae bacterium]|nr:hypothetical protein [Candidatus Binataceae bacterium]
STGRARERWPAGSHHRRTNILAYMEPGEGRPLIGGSLEPNNSPLRVELAHPMMVQRTGRSWREGVI